jgi:hypothetical protein
MVGEGHQILNSEPSLIAADLTNKKTNERITMTGMQLISLQNFQKAASD